MNSRLCRLNQIEPGRLDERSLARMVIQALPDFYAMIPLAEGAVEDLVIDEMHSEGTECHDPLVALVGNDPVAIICAYPLSEMASRQQASLLQITRRLDQAGRRAFRGVATKTLSVARIEVEDALYIARIAVAQGVRGQGIGKRVFAEFSAIASGRPIALHVDRENDAAIAYYLGLGFEFCSGDEFAKRAMVWRESLAMDGKGPV